MGAMTEFTLALCVDCGTETIGGRGHLCAPQRRAGELERIVFEYARLQLIAERSKARR